MFFITIAALNGFIGLYNLFMGFIQDSMGQISFSSYVSIVSFAAVALILIFVVVPIVNKISELKKEIQIRE
ncbi:hypothetical protein HHO41_11900 [Bacillus sp. DNRA2]|uniref:hypothetical protein n=1 Tax=Bacillus sp. DNRA2 TaxID=2723053 RepID=UPI00145E2971|nr:hypothetical protein [Bacillus sp. DNRA2]NMD70999.1 hypothetical protein [Bacillus sp. DNRA2]